MTVRHRLRSVSGLADGVHTLRIVVLGKARPAARGTIVVGQLWGLTVDLNRYFEHESVALLVGFEALSFVVALAVWLAAPGER